MSADLFIRMLAHPPVVAPSKGWLKVKDAYFFILRVYTADESRQISMALKRPGNVIFTDEGHIRLKPQVAGSAPVDLLNPLPPDGVLDLERDSIANVPSPVYVHDASHIISRNLHYILLKQASQWYLLYNPLHRSSFRAYYREALEAATVNGDVSWGKPSIRTDKHANIETLVRTYCNALTANGPDGVAYLDPMCNMIVSDKQCRESATFLGESRMERSDIEVKARAQAINVMGGSQKSDNAPPDVRVPNCVCIGDPHHYMDAYLPDSFVHEFLDNAYCSGNLSLNQCTILNQATTINVKNSSLNAACGDYTLPPLPPPPYPPPPSSSKPLLASWFSPHRVIVFIVLVIIGTALAKNVRVATQKK